MLIQTITCLNVIYLFCPSFSFSTTSLTTIRDLTVSLSSRQRVLNSIANFSEFTLLHETLLVRLAQRNIFGEQEMMFTAMANKRFGEQLGLPRCRKSWSTIFIFGTCPELNGRTLSLNPGETHAARTARPNGRSLRLTTLPDQ